MDSKIVNREIKKIIVPFLKENGFTVFTSRSAWRYRDNKIDVVNFQSFNSYLADSLGCTTFSFGVNLGILFKEIPAAHNYTTKERNGYFCPEEYACHFRSRLFKKLEQIEFLRDDIWYIDIDGNYLGPALLDIKEQLSNYGFPWFERFENKSEVLRTLLEDDEEITNKADGAFGFGRNPSPNRSYQTGYIALSLGDYTIAKKALKEAIDSGCFESKQLISDFEAIKNMKDNKPEGTVPAG